MNNSGCPTFKGIRRSQKEKERDRNSRQKNMSEIAKVNGYARELGLSYGQYVGRYL